MAAYGFMTDVTCWLTAKNRDQLRNPMLCYRVWAAFSVLCTHIQAGLQVALCVFIVLALDK